VNTADFQSDAASVAEQPKNEKPKLAKKVTDRKPMDRPKEVKLMEDRAKKRKEKRDILKQQYEEKR
jgi:hypothetical protein